MAKKASMQRIADELGLARSAVSRALAGKKGVSEATRRRVQATARRLGYDAETGTPSPKPVQILLLVEERTTREKHFWSHVLNGLVTEVPQHHGYLSIVLTDAHQADFKVPPLLEKAGGVDGVIAMHATDIRAVSAVKRLGLPIVLLDYVEDLPDYDTVIIDDLRGIKQLVTELAGLGHRRFGYIGDLENSSFRSRYEGLLAAMAQNGILDGSPPQWRVPEDLPDRGIPTALICCNDDWALETVDYLLAKGVKVPEKVSVTGFDDSITEERRCRIPLTTLRVDREELGRWAVRTLFQRLWNPDGPRVQVAVGVELVKRASHAGPTPGTPG